MHVLQDDARCIQSQTNLHHHILFSATRSCHTYDQHQVEYIYLLWLANTTGWCCLNYSQCTQRFQCKEVLTRQARYVWRNNQTQRATTVAVEKQWLLHNQCICSPRYPVCKAHAPCCHLWPVRLSNIFPHYLIKGMIFEKKKKKLLLRNVFRISLQLLSETFFILWIVEIKNVYWFSCKVPFILVLF